MLGDEGLQQVLHPVCHDTSPCLALFGREVTSLELRCEYLLSRQTRLMKRYAAVWPDGVFAQLRAGPAGAVENEEHLAALGRDLHAEAGRSGVPVDFVG